MDVRELDTLALSAFALMWKTKIPSKVKIFGWRLIIDRLPARRNLVIRGVINNPHDKIYIFCFNTAEDIHHVFITCPRIRLVWEKNCGLDWCLLD